MSCRALLIWRSNYAQKTAQGSSEMSADKEAMYNDDDDDDDDATRIDDVCRFSSLANDHRYDRYHRYHRYQLTLVLLIRFRSHRKWTSEASLFCWRHF